MAPQELRLGTMPAGLGVEKQAVQVEDDGIESPRQAWNPSHTSGAIFRGPRAHSGGSSR